MPDERPLLDLDPTLLEDARATVALALWCASGRLARTSAIEDAMAIATRASIDIVVLRATDPIFRAPAAWPAPTDILFSNAGARVVRIEKKAFAEATP